MKRVALIAAVLAGTMMASAASAAPMTFQFEQDGYAGGATVSGSFTGELVKTLLPLGIGLLLGIGALITLLVLRSR